TATGIYFVLPQHQLPSAQPCNSISAPHNNPRNANSMATKKQIAANRKNAAKSTGPLTPEGRLTSSQNAVRHGLTATQLVISVEEQSEFHEILHDFQAELQPAGA